MHPTGVSDNWGRFNGVRWDDVEWLVRHPEHIDRDRPTTEEEIAIWRLDTGDPSILPTGVYFSAPPPLEHYDKPWHHLRPRLPPDPAHEWLRLALGAWFAGFRNRPTPETVREFLTAPSMDAYPDDYPRAVLYNLFGCMPSAGLVHLRYTEGLTWHEVVRALHHSRLRSGQLSRRLEVLADPPLRPRYLDAMEQGRQVIARI